MTDFVVEGVFQIAGRGPVVTRSREAASRALDAGESFKAGDVVHCGPLMATITGVESYPVMSAAAQLQGSLLLRGVTKEQLIPGQIWSRVG